MVGSILRLAALAALSIALAGCGSLGPGYDSDGTGPVQRHVESRDIPLQCVPYARDHSGVMIYGDAYTWWEKAAGRFSRTSEPSEGAVMVLYNYAGPNRGHVAVVRDVVDSRTIRVDHANWLDDGAIYTNDPVRDVSPANDWSQVRVYNLRIGAWGSRIYPVQGFIGPGPEQGSSDPLVARGGGGGRDEISALISQDDLTSGGSN
jgi:hypothetical protein